MPGFHGVEFSDGGLRTITLDMLTMSALARVGLTWAATTGIETKVLLLETVTEGFIVSCISLSEEAVEAVACGGRLAAVWGRSAPKKSPSTFCRGLLLVSPSGGGGGRLAGSSRRGRSVGRFASLSAGRSAEVVVERPVERPGLSPVFSAGLSTERLAEHPVEPPAELSAERSSDRSAPSDLPPGCLTERPVRDSTGRSARHSAERFLGCFAE